MKRSIWSLPAALLMALVACAAPARADWPDKPIRIVVTFAPGGAADIWARIIAEHLSAALKQSVVVENRGGGGGIVASNQVARAEPDGYTILMGGLAPQIIAPVIAGNAGFDALRDFTHIAYVGGPPITLVVPPASELRSVDDIIAAAKADRFSGYASSGVGTLGHLVVEYVAKRHNLKLTHIPYNTAAFADIIGGRVPMGSFTWGAALGQVQGGTLRALAVTTETRRPEAPNVPTFKELGYDLVASTWFSFSGPKGMPKEIVQRLNQETIRILELPEVKKRVIQDAFDPRPLTPEQLVAFMEAETARWTPIAQDAIKK
ncbi:MAG: tripartite tricarboxylate transporter substrate binding protein [Xanthobacteraceae bacterium]|nr:tripartite tricarboxylate transporter substrate binding protein [Xanthobacteraceae bacterium]